ncbi:MAG: 2-hydroxyglutaryl-CoA dehydratase, partial [Oscillospiraceae bacterium]
NYIHLLRKALEKADMAYIPVISVNLSGLEKNPGFSISLSFLRKAIFALMYGDMIMNVANQVRPYELTPGTADQAIASCMDWL